MADHAKSKALQPDRRSGLSRRTVMGSGAAAAVLAAGGCGTITLSPPVGECKDPPANAPLRVDMHCHLLNLEDADRTEFISRHVANTDESLFGEIGRELLDLVVRIVEQPAVWFVEQARTERTKLRAVFAEMMDSNNAFCQVAARQQGGFLFSTKHRLFLLF